MSDRLCAAKFFKAHKFESRYDEVPRPGPISVELMPGQKIDRTILFYNVYVRDVCVYCGQTVERVK